MHEAAASEPEDAEHGQLALPATHRGGHRVAEHTDPEQRQQPGEQQRGVCARRRSRVGPRCARGRTAGCRRAARDRPAPRRSRPPPRRPPRAPRSRSRSSGSVPPKRSITARSTTPPSATDSSDPSVVSGTRVRPTTVSSARSPRGPRNERWEPRSASRRSRVCPPSAISPSPLGARPSRIVGAVWPVIDSNANACTSFPPCWIVIRETTLTAPMSGSWASAATSSEEMPSSAPSSMRSHVQP